MRSVIRTSGDPHSVSEVQLRSAAIQRCGVAYWLRADRSGRAPRVRFLSQRAVRTVASKFGGAAGWPNSGHGADRTLVPWWVWGFGQRTLLGYGLAG